MVWLTRQDILSLSFAMRMQRRVSNELYIAIVSKHKDLGSSCRRRMLRREGADLQDSCFAEEGEWVGGGTELYRGLYQSWPNGIATNIKSTSKVQCQVLSDGDQIDEDKGGV